MTEKRFTKQEVYDGINRYQINDSNFIVEILDDGIPMHYSTIVNRLNEQHKTITRLEKENEQLKQSVNNLKDTIVTIGIAYQRKYDRTLVDLVDEVHDEDITDLIKELKE